MLPFSTYILLIKLYVYNHTFITRIIYIFIIHVLSFLERRYSEGEHYRNTWYNGKSMSSNVGKSVSIISIDMQREPCLKRVGISLRS